MKKIFYVLAICAVSLMVSCKGSDGKKDAAASDSEKKTEEVAPEKAETAAVSDANAEEDVAALLREVISDVKGKVENVKSKEDLVAVSQELAESVKALNKKYPNYDPDDKTEEAIEKEFEELGLLIGETAGKVGMTQDDIKELDEYLDDIDID